MSATAPLAAITGASSGLGETFARKLAARGYDLLLIARREDRLRALQQELETKTQRRVEILMADLTDADELENVAAHLTGLPHLQMLVNNAGFGTKGYFFETPLQGQMQMSRLHVLAPVRLTHAVLSGMVERNRGIIINVSSVAAFARSAANASYCATKGWMNDFTEGLRLELDSVRSSVVVQALCPGFTYTEFHDVLGVDRGSVPKSFWLSADFVVEESLRQLNTSTVFVIPDWRYRWFTRFISMVPAWLRLAIERRSPQRNRRT